MGREAKHVVTLTPEERGELQAMIDEGRGAKTARRRARVLLKADQAEGGPAWPDERVAEFAEVGLSTVHWTRQRFVELSPAAALAGPPAPERQRRKLDGAGEARLIAMACGQPPEGRRRWTLRLLADKVVELGVVEGISHETVRRTLKKTSCGRTCDANG